MVEDNGGFALQDGPRLHVVAAPGALADQHACVDGLVVELKDLGVCPVGVQDGENARVVDCERLDNSFHHGKAKAHLSSNGRTDNRPPAA